MATPAQRAPLRLKAIVAVFTVIVAMFGAVIAVYEVTRKE